MPVNKSVLNDEDRKIEQHESIKRGVVDEVHHEIEGRSGLNAGERAAVESVARDLKHEAIQEVASTDLEVRRAKGVARLSQVVDYAFTLVYGLIGLEIGLELFGARQGSAFKRFLDTMTAPLLAPFRGLMPDPSIGSFQLMISFVVALIVYALLHGAIRGLLRLLVERKSSL